MRRIGTIRTTKEIIGENEFFMKKKFGQNFLIDQNVLMGIVNKAGIDKNCNVIEIGPGIGSLTEHLILNANKVISYEIDDNLIPILTKEFGDETNFTLIHQDFLKADVKADIDKYFNDDLPVYLVANLPYYITTPIIMHLLENVPYVKRYAVMVQLEVANRIVANKGGKEYNNLSVAIQYRAKVTKALNVSRNVFMPKPNVDSAVVVFDLYDELPVKAKNERFFFEFVRNAFNNRRKTLVNNINVSYHLDKEILSQMLISLNIDSQIRSEALSVKELVKISEELEKISLNKN